MYVSSRSHIPCLFAYGYAWVFVNGDRWAVQGSWFSMTKEDLENLMNRANDPGVGRGVYAGLGLRVLVKLRGGSQFKFVVRCSSGLEIVRLLDLRIHNWGEVHQSNSPQSLVMASGVITPKKCILWEALQFDLEQIKTSTSFEFQYVETNT